MKTYKESIVSALVLITPIKPQHSNFSAPPPLSLALKNLKSPPRQTKSPDNSDMLHMFNNNIYTDFKTAHKHILIPIYVIWVI